MTKSVMIIVGGRYMCVLLGVSSDASSSLCNMRFRSKSKGVGRWNGEGWGGGGGVEKWYIIPVLLSHRYEFSPRQKL